MELIPELNVRFTCELSNRPQIEQIENTQLVKLPLISKKKISGITVQSSFTVNAQRRLKHYQYGVPGNRQYKGRKGFADK